MKKAEFLDKLCRELRFHTDPDEIRRLVAFYDQAIDDRMEDGMSEEDAVAAVGDLDDIIREARSAWESGNETQAETDAAPDTQERVFSPAAVRKIDVFDTSGDILILPSPDGDIHIQHTACDRWYYQITGEETVTVRRVRSRQSAQVETMNFEVFGRSFSVSIPSFSKVFSVRLQLKILIPEGSHAAVSINSASGSVECRDVTLEALSVKLADGDVTAERVVSRGKVSLSTASGDVTLQDVSAPEVSLNTVSGDTDLSGVKTGVLTALSVSGDVDGENLAAANRLSTTAVSGDLDLELSLPCGGVNLETVSGDVQLTLPGPDSLYAVAAKASAGSVNVSGRPDSGPNLVRIQSMSGDISVDFR